MRKGLTQKIAFLLIAVFAFSYQFACDTPISIDYKAVGATSNSVVLGGQSIGVNINVNGIMILGFSDFYGEDGKKHCPAKEAGLKEGDVITSINDKTINNATEFSGIVDSCSGTELSIYYSRNNKSLNTSIIPVKSAEDGQFHLGLWAKDGTTGIGTLTFIDPATKKFGALGHGITDVDTGNLLTMGNGSIYYSSISGVKKGTTLQTGELQGYFISSEIGTVS